MSKKGLVSIITVNYNGWRDTCAMIDALWRHETYPYEVIVIDNASAGDDVEQIENYLNKNRASHPSAAASAQSLSAAASTQSLSAAASTQSLSAASTQSLSAASAQSLRPFPHVNLIRSSKNLGFAGGNNLGLPVAKGEYLFFLNNDTEIAGPVLEVMVNRFLADPQIGALSPRIELTHTPGLVQYAGDWRLTPITLRNRCPDAHLPNRDRISREVEVVHGAAMMLRRDVVDRIGPMYEGYFLFYEEFDWSYAVLAAGYKVWFEAAATIYHKEGKSIGLRSPLRERYLVHSRLLFAKRWVRKPYLWLTILYLTIPVTLRNILTYAKKNRWDLVKATIQGLMTPPNLQR